MLPALPQLLLPHNMVKATPDMKGLTLLLALPSRAMEDLATADPHPPLTATRLGSVVSSPAVVLAVV